MSNKNIFKARGVYARQGGNAIIFDMSQYDVKDLVVGVPTNQTQLPQDTKPDETADTQTDIIGNRKINYSPWGNDNRQPNRMIEDIKKCGVLNGGIHAKIRLGIGRGIMPMKLMEVTGEGKEILEPVSNPEIEDWMEENDLQTSIYGWFFDLTGLGQDVARMVFNRAGTKIGICKRHDISELRYEKKNKKGHIQKVHLSGLWNAGQTWQASEASDVITLPLIPSIGPAKYLEGIANKANKEFAYATRLPDWQRHYYSDPLWFAAREWVSIAKGVPLMKAKMFENNMRLKYKVIIHEDYWETYVDGFIDKDEKEQEAIRNELYDQINNYLIGAENAYKSLFIDGKGDMKEGKMYGLIDIIPIDDNTKQGELLPDSAAANIEILFALMMNPALMGASSFGKGYGGGAGSGSDIREATMVQIMIQEFERMSCSKKLNLVSRVNGWKAKIPNLVWRFPGMVLTTLDKGKSTETLIAGNPPA